MATTKLRSVAPEQPEAHNNDLRASVRFCSETGQMAGAPHAARPHWCPRFLAQGVDRHAGNEPRVRLFTRMGYAAGMRDAELARTRAQTATDLEAFMTGPQLHTLEGVVKVTPTRLEIDRLSGKFYGEFHIVIR